MTDFTCPVQWTEGHSTGQQSRHLDLDPVFRVDQTAFDHRRRGRFGAEGLTQDRPAGLEFRPVGQHVGHAHDVAEPAPRLFQRPPDIRQRVPALFLDRLALSDGAGDMDEAARDDRAAIADSCSRTRPRTKSV